MTDTLVPGQKAAVDQTSPVREGWDANLAVPLDTGTPNDVARAKRPFTTPNGGALGVFERSAHDWRGAVVVVSSTSPAAQIVGRLPGRRSVTLWVPSSLTIAGTVVTVTNGVLVAATEGELFQAGGGGIQLNVGDSLRIESEAPVWVGLIPGDSPGYVQFLELFNLNEPGT